MSVDFRILKVTRLKGQGRINIGGKKPYLTASEVLVKVSVLVRSVNHAVPTVEQVALSSVKVLGLSGHFSLCNWSRIASHPKSFSSSNLLVGSTWHFTSRGMFISTREGSGGSVSCWMLRPLKRSNTACFPHQYIRTEDG